ncbi:uncharacterized protein LOC133922920 [Phragmites australis]|uniref:uncharacterized protein LOC133922920 n=1 Tax=Phragmites australis TaxID=29695 RepID=UPI002D78FDA1|nr:uncharacterized protein LOC133922920 [Phragmites australis]
MDLIGKFPCAKGNLRYAVVALEYFSKWIESEPLTAITSKNVHKFFWKSVICCFGVSGHLTVDNGMQFDFGPFREFCTDLSIEMCFTVVHHPQSNRAIERTNASALNCSIVDLRWGHLRQDGFHRGVKDRLCQHTKMAALGTRQQR